MKKTNGVMDKRDPINSLPPPTQMPQEREKGGRFPVLCEVATGPAEHLLSLQVQRALLFYTRNYRETLVRNQFYSIPILR